VKALVVSCKSEDHLTSLVFDGLQEVLGEDNVVDAYGSPWLHSWPDSDRTQDVGTSRQGKAWGENWGPFDLLVIHSCYNRDYEWPHVASWLATLKPGGKVAYVEGWDAAWQIHCPPGTRADAYFRKEIKGSVSYPIAPHCLGYAAPSRWFWDGALTAERDLDVSWIGNPETGHPDSLDMRWDMLSATFRTRRKHACVIATKRLGMDLYRSLLRRSKLALCPAAADGADSLRTYEAVAAGCVPIFVGYPDHVRDPWLGGDMCFSCRPDRLPEVLDEALKQAQSGHLDQKRAALWEHARKHHTTAARARKILGVLGLSP
jgi:hypothetical protein